MAPKADLHLHSSLSDGGISPKKIAELILSERYDDLNTVSKTDHDTLLGTEEFLRALDDNALSMRVIAGTEISTTCPLPHLGKFTMHSMVYFYTSQGFDLMPFTRRQRASFFNMLADEYLHPINKCVEANNRRRLGLTRAKANAFFFGGDERITEEELKEASKRRLESLVGDESIINLDNSLVAVSDVDIMDLLVAKGVMGPASALICHFRRNGPCYAKQTDVIQTAPYAMTEGILSEIQAISERCAVKAKVGQAHPQTYVRQIARAIAGERGEDAGQVYTEDIVESATEAMTAVVTDLARRGLISFIETEYPMFSFNPPEQGHLAEQTFLPKPAGTDSRENYSRLLRYEMEFSSNQRKYWTKLARSLGLPVSGGSDTHFKEGTAELAHGFGDLNYMDELVDELFR
jgi:DNA polymerase III alpha subunit